MRGHHWPERWVTDRAGQRRMPGLFVAGELLAAGGRAVLEVMLYEGHLRARSRTRHPGHPDVGA